MRKRYQDWEVTTLVTLGQVDALLRRTAVSTDTMLASSRLLRIVHAAGNTDVLSMIHTALRHMMVKRALQGVNCLAYLGELYLTAQLAKSDVIETEKIIAAIQASIKTEMPPSLSGLEAHITPPASCHDASTESFADQLSLSMTINVDSRKIDVLMIFDISNEGVYWNLQLARRSFVCFDPTTSAVEKRTLDREVNAYLKAHASSRFNAPVVLPDQQHLTYSSSGEAITSGLVSFVRATSNVQGFRLRPAGRILPSDYILPRERDVGIFLATSALEAMMSSAVLEYETAPANWSFFHEDYFAKHVSKDVVLTYADSTSFTCNIGFSAKFESTTWGIDWNCDIYGYIPVRCSFSRAFGVNGLTINVQVRQTAKLQVTGHQLHAAGALGDIFDSLTRTVDQEIAGRADRMPWIDAPVTLYSSKDARDGNVKVLPTGLILELLFIPR